MTAFPKSNVNLWKDRPKAIPGMTWPDSHSTPIPKRGSVPPDSLPEDLSMSALEEVVEAKPQPKSTVDAAIALVGVEKGVITPTPIVAKEPTNEVHASPTTPPEPNSPPEEEEESRPATVKEPQDRDVEEATVGSVLINPACYSDLAAILKPADFYIVRHRWIWQALENLTAHGFPLDFLMISRELTRMGQLEDIGGPAYLTSLLNQVPTSVNAVAYASIVKEFAAKRRMLAVAREITVLAYDPRVTAEEVGARALEAVRENVSSPMRRYVVHDAAEALAPRSLVEWIVKDLIYKKSIAVFYGDGGTKKTWSTAFLAACVSCGIPWGDFETHKSRVLFIDEENGEDEIAERVGRCLRGASADESAYLRYISLAAFHLDDPKDEVLLTAEILNQDAELVVMDALADLMIGDENSKQDTQPVFNALRRIAEKTGAAILVIHHANKNGGHRGSSVIKDAPDILFQVTSDPESNFINFKTEKNRKGKAMKWSMCATWSQDNFYLTSVETLEKVKAPSKSQDYVIRFLMEHGASSIPVIMAGADTCSPEAARKAVYKLADLKKIHRTNPGETGQGTAAIYDLL